MPSLGLIVVIVLVSAFIFFGLASFVGAPYVPSQKKYVRRLFEHLRIDKDDVVVDLGSGDGVVLRIAASFGAAAHGYEINPLLVGISRWLSAGNKRVHVRLQNVWVAQFPEDTTLVYAFSVSRDEPKLTVLLQHEADRLGRPLKLVCFGSPFAHLSADLSFEAYHLYVFHPLQPKSLKV
jgi:hypothetical protein